MSRIRIRIQPLVGCNSSLTCGTAIRLSGSPPPTAAVSTQHHCLHSDTSGKRFRESARALAAPLQSACFLTASPRPRRHPFSLASVGHSIGASADQRTASELQHAVSQASRSRTDLAPRLAHTFRTSRLLACRRSQWPGLVLRATACSCCSAALAGLSRAAHAPLRSLLACCPLSQTSCRMPDVELSTHLAEIWSTEASAGTISNCARSSWPLEPERASSLRNLRSTPSAVAAHQLRLRCAAPTLRAACGDRLRAMRPAEARRTEHGWRRGVQGIEAGAGWLRQCCLDTRGACRGATRLDCSAAREKRRISRAKCAHAPPLCWRQAGAEHAMS
jgi:hypothetical protein